MTVGKEEFVDCYFCSGTGEVWIGEVLGECPKCEGKRLLISGETDGRKECSCHIE